MSLFDFLSGGNTGNSILMQAIGAAMRGEDAQTWMKNLASQHPQLRCINFDDLPGAANQLCQQRGINPNDVVKEVDGVIDPLMRK